MTGNRRRRGEASADIALALTFLLSASLLGAQREPFNISVDVNLVVLHASVHDRHGNDVLNLKRQDFKLYEDGVPQPIQLFRREDTPVTVGLIVDHSGSMMAKLNDVTAAARTFAQSSNPKDQLFVVNFNEKVFSGLPGAADQFTDDPMSLQRAIARAPADGRTALYDAIAAGLEQLDAGHWDKKVLVVISDGGDNASTHTLSDVTSMAERSSAVIYTIGIFAHNDADANPRVLKRLAQTTGGAAWFPAQSYETADACAHIARDIRNQYMIGYVSSNLNSDAVRRSVRLVAESPGSHARLNVRTRNGYVAQGSVR